jgi:hypothetical protein
MTKLLANRWFRTAFIAIALLGLGIGIYRFMPLEPMCVIEGNFTPIRFAEDGRMLVTYPMEGAIINAPLPGEMQPSAQGPLELWDVRSGVKTGRYLAKDSVMQATAFSADGRFFACEQKRIVGDAAQKLICVIDIVAGTSREIPLDGTDQANTALRLSPDGELLVRHCLFDEKTLRIFDTARGALVDHRESNGFDAPEDLQENALLHTVPKNPNYTTIEVWSWRERKPIALLENAGPNRAVSPDGRYYVAEKLSPEGVQVGKWGVWNLRTHRLEAEFQSKDTLVTPRVISPDGRWLAAECMGEQGAYVEVRELPTGKQVGTLAGNNVKAMRFAPDGRSLVLQSDRGVTQTVEMFEVPSLRPRWKLEGLDPLTTVQYSPDARTIFLRPALTFAIAAHDVQTGQKRTTFSLAPRHPMQMPPSVQFTPDCRSLLAHEQMDFMRGAATMRMRILQWMPWLPLAVDLRNDTVAVIDTNTCREWFRLYGWGVSAALLSDDGRTLVTVHDEAEDRRVLRCWDVAGWKPMRWAIGVPLALAGLYGLIAWGRARKQARGESVRN